jgi:glycosyltransferase involved in cell wall biosynthesis
MDGGLQLIVDRMAERISTPEARQPQPKPFLLKAYKLLRNERRGDARPTLHDDANHGLGESSLLLVRHYRGSVSRFIDEVKSAGRQLRRVADVSARPMVYASTSERRAGDCRINRSPKVSVILPVYNREHMVRDAIASVLHQSMTDFELIVVDDGSTDQTAEIVDGVDDTRVRLVRHECNRGIPSARNSGLKAATGQYIAWLDSDDLARPSRFAVQTDFLDANPSIAMVGGQSGAIRPNGRRKRLQRRRPASHEEIVAMLLFRSPMLQSSIMGRAQVLKQFPYRLDFPVCQDLEMLGRLTRGHRVANLPQTLVDRRFHAGQVINRRANDVIDRKKAIFRVSLKQLGIHASEAELDRHILLGRPRNAAVGDDFLRWSKQWLEQITAANRSSRIYSADGLEFAVRRMWHLACFAALRGPDRLSGLAALLRRSWN